MNPKLYIQTIQREQKQSADSTILVQQAMYLKITIPTAHFSKINTNKP